MTKFHIEVELPDGRREVVDVEKSGACWFGRDESCDVVLPSTAVSRRHLWIEAHGEHLRVRDASANGTLVDGVVLMRATRIVDRASTLRVGPYLVHVRTQSDMPRAETPPLPSWPLAQQAEAPAGLGVSVATRRRIHRLLLDHLDLVHLDRKSMDDASMRPKVQRALYTICQGLASEVPTGAARDTLVAELCDEVLGLGPLEQLLADPTVSEIMVVDPSTIFAERAGRIERTALCFTDEDSARAVIERIVTPLGRRIDESNPLVDARLKDGSRVNAVIPPLANKGPCITIRKFAKSQITFERLIRFGSLDERMVRFLTRAVRSRRNIVVSGGTGSGKTTLLNVLSSAIAADERIITIEDAAELRLHQSHVVSLETRPPNLEGRGEFTIRDLLKNALRMRPDRILVGECRGGEAIDMLQAMNTGHEGSMTTTHANSPREAVSRLETLCLMAGVELPLRAVRAQIAASIHIIVQQSRFSDGSRRITHISEVTGIDERGDVELAEVFRYARSGTSTEGKVDGEFQTTGYLPKCLAHFVTQGLVTDGVYL